MTIVVGERLYFASYIEITKYRQQWQLRDTANALATILINGPIPQIVDKEMYFFSSLPLLYALDSFILSRESTRRPFGTTWK